MYFCLTLKALKSLYVSIFSNWSEVLPGTLQVYSIFNICVLQKTIRPLWGVRGLHMSALKGKQDTDILRD